MTPTRKAATPIPMPAASPEFSPVFCFESGVVGPVSGLFRFVPLQSRFLIIPASCWAINLEQSKSPSGSTVTVPDTDLSSGNRSFLSRRGQYKEYLGNKYALTISFDLEM